MKLFFNPKQLNLSKFQTQVSPQLVRGKAIHCPYMIYKMKQNGVNQIIDLRNSAFFQSRLEKFYCKLFGIKYYNFKYSYRLYNLPEHDFFEKINNTIINNDGQTYIHCQHGKRRTGICVAVYQKECLKKTYEEIFADLFNFGFRDMLTKKSQAKRNHLMSIYCDFVKRYYPQFAQTFGKE